MSTYMEIVEAYDANPNTIKEPAKRWRNWYDVKAACNTQPYKPGERYCGRLVWPSREVAEQKAIEAAVQWKHECGKCDADWLGAYPEGERP